MNTPFLIVLEICIPVLVAILNNLILSTKYLLKYNLGINGSLWGISPLFGCEFNFLGVYNYAKIFQTTFALGTAADGNEHPSNLPLSIAGRPLFGFTGQHFEKAASSSEKYFDQTLDQLNSSNSDTKFKQVLNKESLF